METGRKVKMLIDYKSPTVYNNSENKRSYLWNQGYVLFANAKNLTMNFQKARKVKMVMLNNVKHVDLSKIGNIIKDLPKLFLQNMKDGQKEIQKKFWQIKELIMKEIEKRFSQSSKKPEKLMGTIQQRNISRTTKKKLHVITMWLLQLSSAILYAQNYVTNVKLNVSQMLTTMTIQNPWKLLGFVENVMGKNIESIYQRERLSLEGSKEYAIVQTTEETCRGEFEAVPPPRNWSVGKLLPKVIEWLRHTAGCSFYQGQCITNDLWIQNLRSTGI